MGHPILPCRIVGSKVVEKWNVKFSGKPIVLTCRHGETKDSIKSNNPFGNVDEMSLFLLGLGNGAHNLLSQIRKYVHME